MSLVLNDDVFYHAVELKRLGEYDYAIYIYKGEIKKMMDAVDFHEYSTYANALAKCFYLAGEPKKAIACYTGAITFNLLTKPTLIRDLNNEDPAAVQWLVGIADKIGYFLHYNSTGIIDEGFAACISGKTSSYEKNKYLDIGLDHAFARLQEGPSKEAFAGDLLDITT